jgi:hypothetical protein
MSGTIPDSRWNSGWRFGLRRASRWRFEQRPHIGLEELRPKWGY